MSDSCEKAACPLDRQRTLSYRYDIDGLRAIAVLLVLLFHFDLGIGGGFIGVDVFFVISGYLITGVILSSVDAGKFSFRTFWSRRIRRLFPAAAVMFLVVLVIGFLILPPQRLLLTARTALAQQFWVGNVFLWQTTGYFEAPAENNPLLHVWSLSVEEQFYAIFPLFLVGTARTMRKWVFPLVMILLACSFAMSVYGVSHHKSATFYLLPTRAWELLLGSVVWLINGRYRPKPHFCEALGWFAVTTGILLPAAMYTRNTPFPGLPALLPCIATGCLIWVCGDSRLLISRVLGSTLLRPIGHSSYSLYLWHWPIIVFGRVLFEFESTWVRILLLGLSGIVSYASYIFIETPLRKGGIGQTRWILCSLPTIALICLTVIYFDGLPSRIPDAVAKYERASRSIAFQNDVSYESLKNHHLPSFGSLNGTSKVVVWGDSHAMSLMPGIDSACRKLAITGYQATHSSTPPLMDFVYQSEFGIGDQNSLYAEAVIDFIKSNKINAVIISAAWWSYSSDPEFEFAVQRTIRVLTDLDVKVVLVLDVATHNTTPEERASRAWLRLPLPEFTTPKELHLIRNEVANRILYEQVGPKVMIVDPSIKFCNADGDWLGERGDVVYYRDDDHLSVEGSLLLEDLFVKVLEECLERPRLEGPSN